MTGRTAYSSTVVSAAHLCAGVALAVGTGVAVAALGSLWLAAVCAAVVAVSAAYLSTVRLLITRDVILVGYGPRGWRPRVISTRRVISAQPTWLSWPQVLGFGMAPRFRLTRLTIRPGPTLCLELNDGEQVRVSTPHPEAAVAQLGHR